MHQIEEEKPTNAQAKYKYLIIGRMHMEYINKYAIHHYYWTFYRISSIAIVICAGFVFIFFARSPFIRTDINWDYAYECLQS